MHASIDFSWDFRMYWCSHSIVLKDLALVRICRNYSMLF